VAGHNSNKCIRYEISLPGNRNKNAQDSSKVTRRPNGGAAGANGTTKAKEKGGPTGALPKHMKMDEFIM